MANSPNIAPELPQPMIDAFWGSRSKAAQLPPKQLAAAQLAHASRLQWVCCCQTCHRGDVHSAFFQPPCMCQAAVDRSSSDCCGHHLSRFNESSRPTATATGMTVLCWLCSGCVGGCLASAVCEQISLASSAHQAAAWSHLQLTKGKRPTGWSCSRCSVQHGQTCSQKTGCGPGAAHCSCRSHQ